MLRALDAAKKDRDDSKDRSIKNLMETPKFGSTGNYPMGTLDKGDEGEIVFGVASHRGKVILNFGKPVAWIGMDAGQAVSLAQLLLRHAARCRDIGDEQKSQATAKEHTTAQ